MDSAGIEKTQGKTDGDSTRDGAQRKAAVLFPGIGYQFDRPLLHFAWEQAAQYGYEVIPVGYSGFPSKIRGNRERMAQSLRMAEEQTEEILRGVDWQSYGRIVFVSKSIGTIAATHYAAGHRIAADQILFTPFPETFAVPMSGRTLAFHAATDPWMDHESVVRAAKEAGVPMISYPEGNHSLETGDALRDIRTLEEIFTRTAEILREEP